MVKGAHEMGLRIFPSLRMQTPNKPVPRDMAKGTFWEKHPEFHCRDKKGDRIGHLSLAFPEVRAFWISLLCEALEYGFDGVHVIFCRSWPFAYYEDPVVRTFQEEYGEDPRACPEDDPRFQRVLSSFITQFARELKGAVEGIGRKMCKKLEIAYNVNTTVESNMQWGIDVGALVKEGLVDYLMPHPTVAMNAAEWIKPLAELVKGTPVKLYPDLYPRRQPPAASLYSAQTLYELGCDGIALWDTYSRVFRISEWAMMKRLGHREDIRAWREAGKGDTYFRVLDFTWLGDRSGDPRFFQTDG